MKIFIGSSSKKKQTARNIARILGMDGFQVLKWWDTNVFQPGDYTLARLIEVSKLCDAAVMVFGADDEMFDRTSTGGGVRMVPRDNVVLEYGLFAGQVGMDRTLIVADPDIKIPTDLQGITVSQKSGYANKISTRLTTVLGTAMSPSKDITIHANRQLFNILREGGASSWVSRSLYLGSRGANLWKAVETDHAYTGAREFTAIRNSIVRIAKASLQPGFDCIVSFGPGVASLDKEVVPFLRGTSLLSYIPIDINPHLAFLSAETVDAVSSDIYVPFCILGDFEEGMSDITSLLHSHTSPGRVFLMLGGTFGNLERTEDGFLQGLRASMDREDVAILDVFTAQAGYSVGSDPLLPLSDQPESVRLYLANSISQAKGVQINTVASDIDRYLEGSNYGSSSIPNTKNLAIMCKQDNRPIIYVRRYNFNSFGKHLQDLGFNIIDKEETTSPGVSVGRAVYIFKR